MNSSISDVYKKWKLGDSITNSELDSTIKKLPKIVDALRSLGPEFHFSWKELYMFQLELVGFQIARKRTK